MTTTNISKPSLSESIEQLFLRFLVGKNKIYKEEEYNDGLLENESEEDETPSNAVKTGWDQRVLLDVEKERVIREQADLRLKEKRNTLLKRRFQQLLLKVINQKLDNSKDIISNKLQIRDNTVEILKTLLASEPRYSVLASLLELDISLRNRLVFLVNNEHFMRELGRDSRNVRDIQSVVGMIGTDVLRFLVPAILFKSRVNASSQHNALFPKKLWRYQMTLGQTCSALMLAEGYRRPYEGILLSAMINFGYAASYREYVASFDSVRMTCLDRAREKQDKNRHDFFFEIQTDSASLQSLLIAQANLQLSLSLSEEMFRKDFPHLVNALAEEVTQIPFEKRSFVGKVLFKAIRFAKYEQLRASRLFKSKWLNAYLQESQIDQSTYKNLVRQELFRFKPIW